MPKSTDSKVTRVTRKAASGTVAGKTATSSSASSMSTAGTAVVSSVTGPAQASVSLTPDVVAARAYAIYLEEGRPEGRELEHWTRAEAELLRS
jgi:hypothetical protein